MITDRQMIVDCGQAVKVLSALSNMELSFSLERENDEYRYSCEAKPFFYGRKVGYTLIVTCLNKSKFDREIVYLYICFTEQGEFINEGLYIYSFESNKYQVPSSYDVEQHTRGIPRFIVPDSKIDLAVENILGLIHLFLEDRIRTSQVSDILNS